MGCSAQLWPHRRIRAVREGWGAAAGVGAELVSLAGARSEGRTCGAKAAAHTQRDRPGLAGAGDAAALRRSRESCRESSVLGLGRAPWGRARAALSYRRCWAAAGVGAESLALSVHPKALQAAVFCILCDCSHRNTRSSRAGAGGRRNVERQEVRETRPELAGGTFLLLKISKTMGKHLSCLLPVPPASQDIPGSQSRGMV